MPDDDGTAKPEGTATGGRAGTPLTGEAPASVWRQRVRPRHCDAQGMLHAARYYGYFEDAFLDWLDQHADGYRLLRTAGTDLVIVANGCEYRSPARLDELLSIETRPVSMGTSSLTVSFTVRGEERTVALGHARYVCVAGGSAVPIPASLRRVLDPGGDRSPA